MGKELEKKEEATSKKAVVKVKFLKPGAPYGFAYMANEFATLNIDQDVLIKLQEKGIVTRF
jgi:uncharacterized protein (DUF4415 family)